jgi:hypothetical protein
MKVGWYLNAMVGPIKIDRFSKPDESGKYVLSDHAIEQMCIRGVSDNAVIEVLTHGRISHTRKAKIFAIGRKEVKKLAKINIDIAEYINTHVVCSADNVVITVYKNDSFKDMRVVKRGRAYWKAQSRALVEEECRQFFENEQRPVDEPEDAHHDNGED